MAAAREGSFRGEGKTRLFHAGGISDRFLLLLLYWAISIAAFFVFGGIGGGRELLESVPILASWGIAILQYSNIFGSPTKDIAVANVMIVFFCIFLAYLFGLQLFTTLIRRSLRSSFPFAPMILHGVGTVVSMLKVPPRHYYQPIGMHLAAWVFPLCLVIGYLCLDWRLAKGKWDAERSKGLGS